MEKPPMPQVWEQKGKEGCIVVWRWRDGEKPTIGCLLWAQRLHLNAESLGGRVFPGIREGELK